MYNCIQLCLKRYNAAYRRRFYAVEFKLLYPRIFLISDSGILFENHSVKRHINRTYLRFFAIVIPGKIRAVSVGKTYRHLRLGGITSGARIIC